MTYEDMMADLKKALGPKLWHKRDRSAIKELIQYWANQYSAQEERATFWYGEFNRLDSFRSYE